MGKKEKKKNAQTNEKKLNVKSKNGHTVPK